VPEDLAVRPGRLQARIVAMTSSIVVTSRMRSASIVGVLLESAIL